MHMNTSLKILTVSVLTTHFLISLANYQEFLHKMKEYENVYIHVRCESAQ